MNCIGENQNDSMINSLMARSLRRVSFAEEVGLDVDCLAKFTRDNTYGQDGSSYSADSAVAGLWGTLWAGQKTLLGRCLEKAPSFGSSKLLSESYLCFLWLKHSNRMQVDSPCPHQQVKPKAEKDFLKFSQMARMWSPTLSLAQTHFHQCPGLVWTSGAHCQR